ncbi:MAG: hypothetical protein ACREBJ_02310, partial [Nitrosotalea sp.]
ITLTVADDGADERTDVIIQSSAGGNHNLLDGAVDQDTVAASPLKGSIVKGNSTPKWGVLPLGTDGFFLKSSGGDLIYVAIAQSDVTGLVSALAAKADLVSGQVPSSELGNALVFAIGAT